MRSSVADYEVIKTLPPNNLGQLRYLCQPPERFGLEEPVMVTELAVDASGWRDLAGHLSVLARTPSPHLLGLLEVGPDLDPQGAGVYLASEAALAGTAADAQPKEPRTSIAAVATAARGAHALHESGVAHGSIDPRAILFTGRGPVLAPPPLGGPPGVVARAKSWKDLVACDPGLLRGEQPSRASDLWSLAATLHALLSDRPLYPDIATARGAEPIVTTVQRVLFTRPEPDPALPHDLAEILSNCFAADPADRPATADQLADQLFGLLP